jgi:hypothetical protein
LLLSVSYNISTNDSSLLQTLENSLRFDTSDPKLLSYLYKIKHCSYNTNLTAALLASALLHCQSEKEEIRQLATGFCVLLATGVVGNVHFTAHHAMECGVEHVKGLCVADERELFVRAIGKVRKKVLSDDERGFDINSNAHFDRKLFLDIVLVQNPPP